MLISQAPHTLVNQIANLAEMVASQLELVVVDVRFGQQGKRKSIQITVFRRERPIGLSDCENMSRQLETLLDQIDPSENSPVKGSYVLEVQSPGINRELRTEKEFQIFSGQKVEVQIKATAQTDSLKADTVFSGILAGTENGRLKITHSSPVNNQLLNKKQKYKHKRQLLNNNSITCTPDPTNIMFIDMTNVLRVTLNARESLNISNQMIESCSLKEKIH